MSIIVDTNILVRAVTLDHPTESPKAAAILQSEQVYIPTQSLCEMIWVLRRLYKLNRAEQAQAITSLIGLPGATLDRAVVEAGLAMMARGGDFADGVIAFEGQRLGGRIFATFDKKAATILRDTGQEALLLVGNSP